MPVNPPATLNKGRAILTFALAYIAVTILGIALSLSISAVGHIPQTAEPMQNTAYLLSERFLPMMNLLVWMLFSWMYFQKRPKIATSHRAGTLPRRFLAPRRSRSRLRWLRPDQESNLA